MIAVATTRVVGSPTPTATPNCGDHIIVPPEVCEPGIPCGLTNNFVGCTLCL